MALTDTQLRDYWSVFVQMFERDDAGAHHRALLRRYRLTEPQLFGAAKGVIAAAPKNAHPAATFSIGVSFGLWLAEQLHGGPSLDSDHERGA